MFSPAVAGVRSSSGITPAISVVPSVVLAMTGSTVPWVRVSSARKTPIVAWSGVVSSVRGLTSGPVCPVWGATSLVLVAATDLEVREHVHHGHDVGHLGSDVVLVSLVRLRSGVSGRGVSERDHCPSFKSSFKGGLFLVGPGGLGLVLSGPAGSLSGWGLIGRCFIWNVVLFGERSLVLGVLEFGILVRVRLFFIRGLIVSLVAFRVFFILIVIAGVLGLV